MEQVHDLLFSGLRLLFTAAVPAVVAILIGGLLMGVLQGATTVRDVSIGYFGRLLALVAALYLIFPLISSGFIDFARRCFG